MDSQFAADPLARDVLEKLAHLERTAGVRAHYRILEPPPLSGTDASSLQTAARLIGDWIGLRNAVFHIVLGEGQSSHMTGIRLEKDQEEFTVELPREAVVNTTAALAGLSREVARAYLHKANIRGGADAPVASDPSFIDVTTVFLGLGKLLLNGAAARPAKKGFQSRPGDYQLAALPAAYIAFAHRATCAMRGLDYEQHVVGLSQQSLELLRSWDAHRDDVFTLSLRNVLTASAPHRPLQEAIADNQIVLSRFDQLLRQLDASLSVALHQELAAYHHNCHEAMSRLSAREGETYDPCMVYLNQVRRRMDLQRLADSLQSQQESVLQRLKVLLRGMETLYDQGLLQPPAPTLPVAPLSCPFDGTPVPAQEEGREGRVQCPTCGYEFLGTAAPPVLDFAPGLQQETPVAETEVSESAAADQPRAQVHVSPSVPTALREQRIVNARHSGTPGGGMMITGIILLALGWLPFLGYFAYANYRGLPAPYTQQLGWGGMGATALGLVLLLIGIVMFLLSLVRGRNRATLSPATETSAATPTPEAAAGAVQ